MTPVITVRAGDTQQQLQVQLTEQGQPIQRPLTGATIKLVLLEPFKRARLEVTGSLISETDKIVAFPWTSTDTATPGLYRAEIQVTYSDGATQTFPSEGPFAVRILPRL